MISRPTTDQLILECRRELLDVVLPDVQTAHVRVAIQMLENVLRNAATRSAHEIAWMREETIGLETYVTDVLAAIGDGGATTHATEAALTTLAGAPRDSVELADVVETYALAGEAFSCALELAMAAGHAELSARAADLLAARNRRELEINGEWAMVGRF
jgi:hypothetical protein